MEGGHDVCSLFDPLVFFPTLTQEMLDENQSWLKPAYIDPASDQLMLCVEGIGCDDIDFVMCTHLHVDHIGRNTRLENGRCAEPSQGEILVR